MSWRVIARNIFSNWASYVVTAVIGFLLSPLIVHSLGTTGYGLWTLVLSMTGYFGLLDLGIRSSVGRFVARYVTLHDEEKTNRIVSTAFAILFTGGVLTLLATVIVAEFFFPYLHVEAQLQSVGRIALLVTGLTMACALPLGVFSSVLVALEHYHILSGVTIIGEVIRAVLIVVALKSGHGLLTLAAIAFFISVSEYLVMAAFAKQQYRPLRISPGLVDAVTFRELFGFGVHRFIWMIANQLIFYSDSIVIGIFLNAGAITYYAIAGSLINYGRTIVSLLTDTFYPGAARLDARQDLGGLRNLLVIGTRISLLVSLPLCLGFVFLGRQFITLWMGPEYSVSALYLMVLTLAQFTGMSQYMSALVLAAMAKHRFLAYLVLVEGVANLVLSIILIRKIGLVGVAWGTVIPDVICTAVIVPWYTLRKLQLSAREYLMRGVLRPVICLIPAGGMIYVFSGAEAVSWARFGGEVAAVAGMVAVMSYFLCLEPEHRALAQERIRQIFQREPVTNEA